MAALVAMGSGPVLSNKQAAITGQIKISLSFQKKLAVIIHACRSLLYIISIFIFLVKYNLPKIHALHHTVRRMILKYHSFISLTMKT